MDVKSFIKSASLEELDSLQKFLTEEIKRRNSKPDKIGKVQTFTDGAARGNPGHAGIGALIFDEKGDKITQQFQYIGETTNNEAEYRALLLALDMAYEITVGDIECYADSQLMIRQLNGQYKLKSEKLRKFFDEVKLRVGRFKSVLFTHVPREHPKLQMADKLANRAIDEAKPKSSQPYF